MYDFYPSKINFEFVPTQRFQTRKEKILCVFPKKRNSILSHQLQAVGEKIQVKLVGGIKHVIDKLLLFPFLELQSCHYWQDLLNQPCSDLRRQKFKESAFILHIAHANVETSEETSLADEEDMN